MKTKENLVQINTKFKIKKLKKKEKKRKKYIKEN